MSIITDTLAAILLLMSAYFDYSDSLPGSRV